MKLCWGLISNVRNKLSHIPGYLSKGTLHKTPGCYHMFGIVKELTKCLEREELSMTGRTIQRNYKVRPRLPEG